MTTRNAAALLLSCLALAGCTFDGTGFGDQPEDTQAGTSTTEPTLTLTGSSTGSPTTTSTTSEDLCGNYFKDVSEECDVGPNGNGLCTPACMFNVCGDNYVGSGEDCDGNVPACENCMLVSCGNGMVDPGEECDDGNMMESDACLTTCKEATCGDTFVQTDVEECDDGNPLDTDACVAGCHNAACGDMLVWEGNEFCDDGNQVDDDDCPNSCAAPGCGDGIKSPMEECDDDNTDNDDGCSATCKVESCGDGVKQAKEECDDGVTQNADTAACTLLCENNECGDGKVLMGGEQCDDGNKTNGDACTNACETAVCGDGITQTGVDECDDGNMAENDACLNNCQLNECGDGKVLMGTEQCDDGNQNEFDGCRNDCKNNICGDGYLNQGVEACDHGPLNDDNVANGTCKNNCTRAGFLVFVTSQLYIPKTAFTSIMTADTLCRTVAESDANSLKIKGTRWKAWMSDSMTGPAMSFNKSAIPYFTLFNGATQKLADNWTDLSDGSLDAVIDKTEKNTMLPGGGNDCDGLNIVWTGTKADNTAGTHCMGWNNNMVANTGMVGTIKQSGAEWTEAACAITCDKSARLYCFEQPTN